MKSKVYPTAENSLAISHPIDGPLKAEGSDWEVDGFTCRMLADSAVTSDPAQAWKAGKPQASTAPSAPADKN